MKRYMKRPLIIEAIQITEDTFSHTVEWDDELAQRDITIYYTEKTVEIDTPEGIMLGTVGDWIIKGIKNECYICKDEIFQASYDPLKTQADHIESQLYGNLSGVTLISQERIKQLGLWSPLHDDAHEYGTLAVIAAGLATLHTDARIKDPHGRVYHDGEGRDDVWHLTKKHQADSIKCLTIAGALIAAEIDRLARQEEDINEAKKFPLPVEETSDGSS